MENRINIAELLKDCPSGMELDCLMYDSVYFKCIREHATYPIVCYTINSKGETEEITFNWYGKYALLDTAKCVIFPKGKTTWEGFHRPFEDGDIIYTKHKLGTEFISIFQIEYERDICTYWDINLSTNKLIGNLHEGNAFKVFIEKDKVKEQRFATEEEKERLFRAIKDNGYQWNTETKTLEKLPKFKVGDKVRGKYTNSIYTISGITPTGYELTNGQTFTFNTEDCHELVTGKFDINTLIPFESKVLVRHNKDNKWIGSFFSFIDRDLHSHCYKFVTTADKSYPMMIPFKGNEYLLGKTNDCQEFYKTWE